MYLQLQGAYTARMVAMFIVCFLLRWDAELLPDFPKGEIGVLDRNDMDHFASIFVNFQRRGTEKDAKGRWLTVCILSRERTKSRCQQNEM